MERLLRLYHFRIIAQIKYLLMDLCGGRVWACGLSGLIVYGFKMAVGVLASSGCTAATTKWPIVFDCRRGLSNLFIRV